MKRTAAGILGALLLALWPAVAADQPPPPAHKLFQPFAARQPTNWTADFGASPALHTALQAYETNPGMATALGVLKHFGEMARNDGMRTDMLARHHDFFLSIDIAKYDMVLHTIEALGADVGAVRRAGSSAEWFRKIEEWVRNGRQGLTPQMDPNKQFRSDDDVTNLLRASVIIADPVAAVDRMEQVNGSSAAEVYRGIALRWGVNLHPEEVSTEFLSPTKAERILERGAARGEFSPLAWNLANAEKYNSLFSVELLEIWAYEKGSAIEVDWSGGRFRYNVRSLNDQTKIPAAPTYTDLIGFVADNYRQIYQTHDGDILSECKYLSRLADGWKRAAGPQVFDPAWEQVARMAELVYKNGPGSSKNAVENLERGPFARLVEKTIKQMMVRSTEYSLLKLGDTIEYCLQQAAQKRVAANRAAVEAGRKEAVSWKPMTFDELTSVPMPKDMLSIDEWRQRFAVSFADVKPDPFKEILAQALKNVKETLVGAQYEETFRSEIFTQVLGTAEEAARETLAQAERYKILSERLSVVLPSTIAAMDANGLIDRVGDGKLERLGYKLVNGVFRKETSSLVTGDEARRQMALIQATAEVGGYPAAQKLMARNLGELAEAASLDNHLRDLWTEFRSWEELHATTNAPQRLVTVTDANGNVEQRTWKATGLNWGRWMLKSTLTGGEYYGKFQGGKGIYDFFTSVFRGSAQTAEERGQMFSAALFSGLSLKDLPQSYLNWKYGLNIETGTPLAVVQELVTANNVALYDVDPAAANSLAYAVVQDVTCVWWPQACPAFLLLDLTKWAYQQYKIAAAQSQLTKALMQRGVWVPEDYKGLATLPPGQLPELTGVRLLARGAVGAPEDPKVLTKLDRKMSLEDGTEFDPRKELIKLGYDTEQLSADPVLLPSIDAIRKGYASSFWSGYLSNDPKSWDAQGLARVGVALTGRKSDSTDKLGRLQVEFPRVPPTYIRGGVAVPASGITTMPVNMQRTLAWLMADFWLKQQQLLEGPVLTAVIESAAGAWLEELYKREILDKKYDFTARRIPEIDRSVAEVDKKLWPRVDRSARPFKADPYEPETHTPILAQFRSATGENRRTLTLIESFLKDDRQTALPLGAADLSEGRRPMTVLDKKQAELRAANELAAMRAQAARIKENYAKVHAYFKQAQTSYTEAAPSGVTACFEPFHLGFLSRGSFAATLARWDGNPDSVRAETWFNAYRAAEQKVATDLTRSSRLQPAGAGAIAQTWEAVTGDNKGVTSHPLWNRLRHLRFEIRKLDDMNDFAADLADADVRKCLADMRVSGNTKPTIVSATDQAVRVAKAREELEAEYQRLLSESTQQSELTLAAAGAVTSPFLFQAMRLSASAPAGTGGVFKKYRWTTRPCTETNPESTVTTDTASVDIRLRRDGEHCVKVWGLDAEGYTIASSKDLKVTARPLTLKGQIGVVGDYVDEPVELNLLGTWLEDPVGPGPLEYLVRAVSGDLERVSPAQARVQVDGVTYTSNASIYEWDSEQGVIQLQTPLELVLPFNVNVTVAVKDLAGNPVKAPKITVTAGNNSVDASSGTARIKLFALTGLKAAIEYPSLNLQADAGAPTGTLQSHNLAFEGKLDMFEAGSLSIRGRLVPVIPTQQVRWVEGNVDSNIGQAPVENGMYDLKNSAAIAPSPEARLTLRAQTKDERGTQWKSLGPEDAGPLPGRSPATAPDLRMATATTIPVKLVDWAGQSLPPRTGKVYRQDQDWNWSPSDSLYLGEYVFTNPTEVISIDGQYPATGFAQVAGKLNVSASQTAISPMPAQTLRLPAYWPGSVRVRGTVKVQSTPAGFTPPQTAQLTVAGVPVTGAVSMGARFDVPLSKRVGRGETIQLVASAVSGTLRFGGSVNVTAPMDPPANVEATLTLEVLNPEAADPCPALQSSARQAMAAGNVASVENLVGQLRAKNCSFTEFQNFLDGRRLQGQIGGLMGQANAATTACDFRTAFLRNQQVMGLDPANGWALQTVDKLRTLAAAQARVEQLLAQAQAAMSNPVEARRLIAEAKQAAAGEKCLLDRIAAVEALIPAAPAGGDILNAAGNNTGASNPNPPPPPPPEEPPPPSRKCTVDISSDRAQGRAGEQVNLTARVTPFDRVAAVNLLAEGCNPCQTQAGGGGVFTARMKFTGRKNRIPLTFVAIDQEGKEQCRGGYSLESLGAGP